LELRIDNTIILKCAREQGSGLACCADKCFVYTDKICQQMAKLLYETPGIVNYLLVSQFYCVIAKMLVVAMKSHVRNNNKRLLVSHLKTHNDFST